MEQISLGTENACVEDVSQTVRDETTKYVLEFHNASDAR
jgi:hypothetical protein